MAPIPNTTNCFFSTVQVVERRGPNSKAITIAFVTTLKTFEVVARICSGTHLALIEPINGMYEPKTISKTKNAARTAARFCCNISDSKAPIPRAITPKNRTSGDILNEKYPLDAICGNELPTIIQIINVEKTSPKFNGVVVP
mmetsp:Transcript_6718/g.8858  ORF Transcript_6718/g.8858 Transcript_6718/m.8858 type:complete len:142 (+) Transcript_6718:129-554(+)